MHLKSITLKGFKSFPDRTRLEFGPGVSVIVGPNGSGKSNVTDAVLWALGEQSPLAVRGQSMQDVIFGGGPGRQAAAGAEVELVLDDSEGMLDLGLPEISIVRRLHRTGEGEYRLGGARCRLIDVVEVLSDTGLGKEMHSVISQGRVEAIVTSRPRERRLLIEEAAGLGKHRKRRRRAQLKLDRTQENLDRALDVEREARSRLRPLKRQAEAAELHARLERQALETHWELARDDLRLQLAARQEAERAAAEVRERRERTGQELRAVAQRREAAEEALAERSARREELSRRCFAAQSAGERVRYRLETVRAAASATASHLARAGELLRSLEAQAAADVPDAEAAGRIERLTAELAALERDRQAELERQLGELEGQREALAARTAGRERSAAAAREGREAAEQRVQQVRAELRAHERAAEAAARDRARVGGELAAVNQFLRNHAAAAGGASTLANRLEVDPGYELALAAALDGRLGAAVVADRAAARELLDRAGKTGGRVLVADGQPGPPPSCPPAAEAALAPTVATPAAVAPPVGAERLADRLRGPEEMLALARALLSDTWVLDTFEELPAGFAGVAVTRSGRVWSPLMREVRQAPAVGEDRVLAERNRREELLRTVETTVQAELAAQTMVKRGIEVLAQADAEQERALAEHRAAVRARDDAAEEERRLERLIAGRRAAGDDGSDTGRRSQLAAELAAERRMAQRSERERADRELRIRRARAELARDEAYRPILARLTSALESGATAIDQHRREFEAALNADREAGEHVAGELRSFAQAEAELQARLHHENEALTGAEVHAQSVRDRAVKVQAEVEGLASRLELAPAPAVEPLPEEQRAVLESRLERLARRREQLGPVNPLAQEEYAAALEHVEELERQREDLEIALRELHKLIVETDREIRERFEETFAAAARNFEELSAELFPGGRGRLRLVTEREGPRRLLGGQAAVGSEREGDEVDEPAELDEDEREDLAGVEIEITPPGKAMKRLSLLSGGEKSMTALAFLFSVFLARPCPFYILDEVEAALDDLNIARFLQLLRKYSSRAQFIVVTHQKRTMEAADSLYGVSMAADGISKVISRKLPREAAA